MSRPAPKLRAPAPAPQIGICKANFHVTAPQGPLSSPELLLQALRREILPVLSEVLESESLIDLEVRIPFLEIDLGHWPDEPRWADLRADFAYKLRLALAPYLRSQGGEDSAIRTPEPGTEQMPEPPGSVPAGALLSGQAPRQGGGQPDDAPSTPVQAAEMRRLAQCLWQLPKEKTGDVFGLIAELRSQLPELFEEGRARAASSPDFAWLARLAAGQVPDTAIAQDLRALLITAFRQAGLPHAVAADRAGRLMAGVFLRFGPAVLDGARDPAPGPAGSERAPGGSAPLSSEIKGTPLTQAAQAPECVAEGRSTGQSDLWGRDSSDPGADTSRHDAGFPAIWPAADRKMILAILRAGLTIFGGAETRSGGGGRLTADGAALRRLTQTLRQWLQRDRDDVARLLSRSEREWARLFIGGAGAGSGDTLSAHTLGATAVEDGTIRELEPQIDAVFRQAGLRLSPPAIRMLLLAVRLLLERGLLVRQPESHRANVDPEDTSRDDAETDSHAPMQGGRRIFASLPISPKASRTNVEDAQNRDQPGREASIAYPALRAALLVVRLLQKRGLLAWQPEGHSAGADLVNTDRGDWETSPQAPVHGDSGAPASMRIMPEVGTDSAVTGREGGETGRSALARGLVHTPAAASRTPEAKAARTKSPDDLATDRPPLTPVAGGGLGQTEDAQRLASRKGQISAARSAIGAMLSTAALLRERGFLPQVPEDRMAAARAVNGVRLLDKHRKAKAAGIDRPDHLPSDPNTDLAAVRLTRGEPVCPSVTGRDAAEGADAGRGPDTRSVTVDGQPQIATEASVTGGDAAGGGDAATVTVNGQPQIATEAIATDRGATGGADAAADADVGRGPDAPTVTMDGQPQIATDALATDRDAAGGADAAADADAGRGLDAPSVTVDGQPQIATDALATDGDAAGGADAAADADTGKGLDAPSVTEDGQTQIATEALATERDAAGGADAAANADAGRRPDARSVTAHGQTQIAAEERARPASDTAVAEDTPIMRSSSEDSEQGATSAEEDREKPRQFLTNRFETVNPTAGEPLAPASTAGMRGDHPETATPEAGRDGDLAEVLGSGAKGLADLRRRWRTQPDAFEALLLKSSVDDLLGIVLAQMPVAATILRESVGHLVQEARFPGPALVCVLRDLFEGRAIDLKAAKAAKPMSEPSGLPMSAGQASRPAPDQPEKEHSGQNAEGGAAAAFFAAQDHPRQAAIATVLHLVGTPAADIRRVLATDSDGDAPAGTGDGPKDGNAALPDTIAARRATGDPADPVSDGQAWNRLAPVSPDGVAKIEALLEAGLDPDGYDLRDSLMLILGAWPSDRSSATDETEPNRADLRLRRNWQLLLERLLDADHEASARETLAGALAKALARIEPDEAERVRALRYIVARIGYGADTRQPELRAKVRRILSALLAGDRAGVEVQNPNTSAQPKTPSPAELIVTECAGIVLLHPFLKPLFSRLNLLNAEGRLDRAGLPRALAALQALDGRTGLRGFDPLFRVLLGLPDGSPSPEAIALDDAGRDLVDSLLRAVVAHWGRLGKTSPDGLRETFLQRPGTLRFEENRVRLRVTPGPFDMLLDSLPWALGVVALPWMALPCHVIWRDRDE